MSRWFSERERGLIQCNMQKDTWSHKLLTALQLTLSKEINPVDLQNTLPLVLLRIVEGTFDLDKFQHVKQHIRLLLRLGCTQELQRIRVLLASDHTDIVKINKDFKVSNPVFLWLSLAELCKTQVQWPEVRAKCIERMWRSSHHYNSNRTGARTGIGCLHKLLLATQQKQNSSQELLLSLMHDNTLLLDWLLAVWRTISTSIRIESKPTFKIQTRNKKRKSTPKNQVSLKRIKLCSGSERNDFTLKCRGHEFPCRREWLIKTSSVLRDTLQADPQCTWLSFDDYQVATLRRFISSSSSSRAIDQDSPDFLKFILMLDAKDLLEMEGQKMLLSPLDYSTIDPLVWVQMAQICAGIPGPDWFQRRMRCIEVVFLHLYCSKTRGLGSCVAQLDSFQSGQEKMMEPFLQLLINDSVLVKDCILIAWNWLRSHSARDEAPLTMPFPMTKVSTVLLDPFVLAN